MVLLHRVPLHKSRPNFFSFLRVLSVSLVYRLQASFKNFHKMPYTINQLFHTSSLLIYIFTSYVAFMLKLPVSTVLIGKFNPGQLKYLTVWNLIIQAVFFFVCTLNDWFGTNAVSPKKPPLIRKVKDYLHAILGFPIAMFVGVTFWSLMFVDRELVLPKALDPYFPWWLNHLMHTVIMFTIMIETILAPRKYPKRSHGLLGQVLFMLTYLIWVHIIYFNSGVWVYPVMAVLSLPLRIMFFAVLMLFSLVLYFVGEAVDNFVWGNEYTKHQKSYAKSK